VCQPVVAVWGGLAVETVGPLRHRVWAGRSQRREGPGVSPSCGTESTGPDEVSPLASPSLVPLLLLFVFFSFLPDVIYYTHVHACSYWLRAHVRLPLPRTTANLPWNGCFHFRLPSTRTVSVSVSMTAVPQCQYETRALPLRSGAPDGGR